MNYLDVRPLLLWPKGQLAQEVEESADLLGCEVVHVVQGSLYRTYRAQLKTQPSAMETQALSEDVPALTFTKTAYRAISEGFSVTRPHSSSRAMSTSPPTPQHT